MIELACALREKKRSTGNKKQSGFIEKSTVFERNL